jgi:hypothetical protein
VFIFNKRLAGNALEAAIGIVLAFSIVAQPARAYADPGSGAVLWQLFFASIVSLGFHFRKLRQWFSSRWQRRAGQPSRTIISAPSQTGDRRSNSVAPGASVNVRA